jgi:hypothetical protein
MFIKPKIVYTLLAFAVTSYSKSQRIFDFLSQVWSGSDCNTACKVSTPLIQLDYSTRLRML